jgi:TRAP-type mannitol/chloroaromatic compound transport system permease small subunit
MDSVRWIDAISRWTGRGIAWLAVPLAAIVTYEVAMRYVFNNPTEWVYDVSWMLHGTAFMIGGAYTLSVKRHVRIDLVYGQLSERGKAVFDLAVFGIVVLPVMLLLTWRGIWFAAEAWSIGEKLSTSTWQFPSAPIKTVIPIGFFLLGLQCVAEILRCVRQIRGEGRP